MRATVHHGSDEVYSLAPLLTNFTLSEFNHLMAHRIKRTIADVVDAFGGTKALATWTGTGESAISNWIARGEIPPGWHYRLHMEAIGRGFEIDPSVFDTSIRRRHGGRCQQAQRADVTPP